MRTLEDFYLCRSHRHAVSEASIADLELDSPISSTVSQWSAGHSRAVTAETLMTPVSTAPSIERNFPDAERSSNKCPTASESLSEVGLAF